MDRDELNRMFDAIAPEPQREQELLEKLLQDDARRKAPVKNWKRVIAGAAVAALLVTTAAAAVVPGISQRLLEYLGVVPEDSRAVNLLLPGAMAVDITKEDNGAVLHVSQILRDRSSIMVLADFTAPEGTVLNMGEQDAPGSWMRKGFSLMSENMACFLDEAGAPIGDGLVGIYNWELLEDDDPLDNRIALMLTLSPDAEAELISQRAAAVRIPAEDLSYFDREGFESEAVYSGDWTVQVPLPQRDIGYVQQMDRAIGELDEARVVLKEVYVSPMTLEVTLTREGGVDLSGWPEESEAAQMRWLSLANSMERTTLTASDGKTAALERRAGGGVGAGKLVESFRLSEITDPARFQGGSITLDLTCGKVTIPLDDLVPAEPQQ